MAHFLLEYHQRTLAWLLFLLNCSGSQLAPKRKRLFLLVADAMLLPRIVQKR